MGHPPTHSLHVVILLIFSCFRRGFVGGGGGLIDRQIPSLSLSFSADSCSYYKLGGMSAVGSDIVGHLAWHEGLEVALGLGQVHTMLL